MRRGTYFHQSLPQACSTLLRQTVEKFTNILQAACKIHNHLRTPVFWKDLIEKCKKQTNSAAPNTVNTLVKRAGDGKTRKWPTTKKEYHDFKSNVIFYRNLVFRGETESDIVEKSLFPLPGSFPSSRDETGHTLVSLECVCFQAVLQRLSNEQTFGAVQAFYQGTASDLTFEGKIRSTYPHNIIHTKTRKQSLVGLFDTAREKAARS